MKSLSFNDGRESFMVNDDPNRVIRFNPADPEIINRILDVQKMFQDYRIPDDIELNQDGSPKNAMERDGAYVSEFTKSMRKAFNSVFNADVYDTVFDGQSPLCIVNGKYLFEGVLDGLKDIVEPAVKEYAKENQKKMDKYLGDL